jgi:RimJ/RimL family protein N-acetyltransferase
VPQPDPPPRVETPRLLLREWRDSDFEPHAAMCADPEVMRFLGGTLDRAESWKRMAEHAGHWTLRGYGKWAVERRDSGAWIGRVGLWHPPDWPGVEVGWTLVRDGWRQGFATEAAAAAVGWGWANLEIDRLVSLIEPDNAASIRVAERLGMRRLPAQSTVGTGLTVFALDRPPAR